MPGIFEHDPCRFLESLHITLLTETAASDTATLDLQSDTVLCCLDMRNNRCFQLVVVSVHVDDELFFYFFRHICMLWTERFDRTVFFISNFIERRHIDPRDLCGFQKEILPAAAGFLICLVCVK